jgi:hypothetical protein
LSIISGNDRAIQSGIGFKFESYLVTRILLGKSEIFSRCKSNLDDADMVIALLDGPQVDDGTAWEIGYFALDTTNQSGISEELHLSEKHY